MTLNSKEHSPEVNPEIIQAIETLESFSSQFKALAKKSDESLTNALTANLFNKTEADQLFHNHQETCIQGIRLVIDLPEKLRNVLNNTENRIKDLIIGDLEAYAFLARKYFHSQRYEDIFHIFNQPESSLTEDNQLDAHIHRIKIEYNLE